jgi:hypothetical protein
MVIWMDSDFAGCRRARKSMSGGLAVLGRHLVKSWCSTGNRVTVVRRGSALWSSVGLGLRSMLGDFGVNVSIKVNTDASAAKGMANRRGLGKVRHIAVNQLWIQDRVARGDLTIEKVNGNENISDILTKHVNAEDIRVHSHKTRQTIAAGRSHLRTINWSFGAAIERTMRVRSNGVHHRAVRLLRVRHRPNVHERQSALAI